MKEHFEESFNQTLSLVELYLTLFHSMLSATVSALHQPDKRLEKTKEQLKDNKASEADKLLAELFLQSLSHELMTRRVCQEISGMP